MVKFVDDWKKQFKRDMLDKGRAGRRMLEVKGKAAEEISSAVADQVLAKLPEFSGFIGDHASMTALCNWSRPSIGNAPLWELVIGTWSLRLQVPKINSQRGA